MVESNPWNHKHNHPYLYNGFNNFNNNPLINIDRSVENSISYYIHIDSLDRDAVVYPNPYDFKVTFNPSPNSYSSDGTLIIGNTAPTISREFTDISKIDLVYISMPNHTKWKVNSAATSNHDAFIPDPDYKTIDDRFISLKIDEIEDSKIYSTNKSFDRSFGNIITVSELGSRFVIGSSFLSHQFETREFLKTLTMKFYNSFSEELNYDHIDRTIDPNVACTGNPLTDLCKDHYPGNPLYRYLQFSIVIKLTTDKKGFKEIE